MTLKRLQILSGEDRIWELDLIRGICVFLMIFDHAMYDIGYVFPYLWFPGAAEGGFWFQLGYFSREIYYPSLFHLIARGIVVGLFIGLCGLSCSFSRSNLKRGLRLLAVALALTAFTWALDQYMGRSNYLTIRFGILHMLALSILCYWALSPLGHGPVLLIGILLAGLGWVFKFFPPELSHNYLGFLGLGKDFYSADFFPFLPWGGYFLIGAALGPLVYPQRRSYFPYGGKRPGLRPVLFTGRHALLFYILHQPLLYLFFIGIGYFITGKILF